MHAAPRHAAELLMDADELGRPGSGERPEGDTVEDGKDPRVDADAERDGSDGGKGEARISPSVRAA
jgi:hypothetical protein